MAICTVEGCERHAVAKGLCNMHRVRLYRHGNTQQTRPDDWGKRESHPLWDSWHSLRRANKLCDEWKDFWVFVKDVGTRPENTRLWKIDKERLFGPDNFFWKQIKMSIKDYESRAAYQRAYRAANPGWQKQYDLKKYYGIDLTQYIDMQEEQCGKCAICGNPETEMDSRSGEARDLAVDHNHKTGQIRALLCRGCNQGLGNFQEDLSRLEAAVSYLKRFAV